MDLKSINRTRYIYLKEGEWLSLFSKLEGYSSFNKYVGFIKRKLEMQKKCDKNLTCHELDAVLDVLYPYTKRSVFWRSIFNDIESQTGSNFPRNHTW